MSDPNGAHYISLANVNCSDWSIFIRLLEYATNYFDLSSFPDGETKRALQRVANKRSGKTPARTEGSKEDGGRDKKKRKTK